MYLFCEQTVPYLASLRNDSDQSRDYSETQFKIRIILVSIAHGTELSRLNCFRVACLLCVRTNTSPVNLYCVYTARDVNTLLFC